MADYVAQTQGRLEMTAKRRARLEALIREGYSEQEAYEILVAESAQTFDPRTRKRRATNRENAKRARQPRVPADIVTTVSALIDEYTSGGMNQKTARAQAIKRLAHQYAVTKDAIRKKLRNAT